jgi:predicted ABC-type ATPase
MMIRQIETAVSLGESFAVETTLAARTYARRIRDWQQLGYHVRLIFLSLPSPEVAITRVKLRVSQRGHSVPEPVIRRRFELGLINFERIYVPLVNSWRIYDNSGAGPVLIRSSDESQGRESTSEDHP